MSSPPSSSAPVPSLGLSHEPWVVITDHKAPPGQQTWMVKVWTDPAIGSCEVLVSNMSLVWFESLHKEALVEKQEVPDLPFLVNSGLVLTAWELQVFFANCVEV